MSKKLTEEQTREAIKNFIETGTLLLQFDEFQDLFADYEERKRILTPYIEQILQSKKKYKSLTVDKVLQNLDFFGRAIKPADVSAEVLKRAGQKKRAADARATQKERQEQQEQPAEKIKYKKGDTLKTTSTKLANEFFMLNPPITEIDGQLTLNTIYTKKAGHDVAVLTYYSYNEQYLQAHGITRREFSDFDYFVAMVSNNLFLEGNNKYSFTKLWHEMGNPKTPNAQQLQQLRESLRIGLSTILHISNKEVLEAWGIETDTYQDIESPVIPVQIKTDINKANGQIMNETIYQYAVSPFLLVADPLNQIATWKKDILKLYKGKRSARYWRVMRYLMQTIAWIRNGGRDPKIAINTLCDAVGDKTRADKQRTVKLTYELLDSVFKPLEYVCSYKTDPKDGGIILKCSKSNKPKLNSNNPKDKK